MAPPYPARNHLEDQVVQLLEQGRSLHHIETLPGMPSRMTIHRWAKARPEFAERMAEARAVARGRAAVLLADGGFDAARAEAFLDRVRAGDAVRDLVRRPEGPHRELLDRWKRAQPAFAAALATAVRFAHAGRSERALGWPFDEAVADRIILRVIRGEALPVLMKDPALPGRDALRRWRRRHPDFDAALKAAMRVGHRVRMREMAEELMPDLTDYIFERIVMGASLHSLGREPDMPHHVTMYGWVKTRRDFARAVAQACQFRDELIAERGMEMALALTPETAVAGERALKAERGRWGRLARHPGQARGARGTGDPN